MSRGGVEPGRSRVLGYWRLAAVLVTVAIGAGLVWITHPSWLHRAGAGTPGLSSERARPAVARRETRPTLDPGRFVGKAALAHQVAREIPDVLDQLYCYCGCDRHLGHKSLLSCYTDSHAAT